MVDDEEDREMDGLPSSPAAATVEERLRRLERHEAANMRRRAVQIQRDGITDKVARRQRALLCAGEYTSEDDLDKLSEKRGQFLKDLLEERVRRKSFVQRTLVAAGAVLLALAGAFSNSFTAWLTGHGK